MIDITRPITGTHKTVLRTEDKYLNSNMSERQSPQEVKELSKSQNEQYKYSQQELEKAVENTNRVLFEDNDHFEFKIHEGTGRIMVKLVNNETDEIIKEIPPEKILDLVATIWDLVGILVDERG